MKDFLVNRKFKNCEYIECIISDEIFHKKPQYFNILELKKYIHCGRK